MNIQQTSKKPQVAIMNAVHDLPVLVARDKGFFKDEGLDIDFVTTPGMAQVTTTNAGSMQKRIEAVHQGKVAAVSLMEPWISVAQKQGLRILIESHSTRSEAAGEDLDGKTLAAMFRAQARAVKEIERDPTPYVHYFIRETGGLLEPHEFQTWRLLHAAPQPYTRERFDDTYNWTVKWNMTVPGATYENTVDNRAWQ